MKNSNIVIGKIGLSINFLDMWDGKKSARYSDMVYLYVMLAQYNPDFNFYIVGPNDMHKLTETQYNELFPYKNVHSLWNTGVNKSHDFNIMLNYLKDNNIKIDFVLMTVCGSSGVCLPNFLPKKDGSPRKLLMSQLNYMAPYVYMMNKLDCPIYGISDDARNVLFNFKDLYNRERIMFSQMEGYLDTIPHVVSATDFSLKQDKVHCIYSHVERSNLIGIPENWKDNIDLNRKLNSNKESHLLVISNGWATNRLNSNNTIKNGRLQGYEEYIINNFKGTPYEKSKIYGKWTDDIYEKYPDIFSTKRMSELENELKDARYSFVYSQTKNFVSLKPWELIICGIIPFIHPDFDGDRLLGLPEYIYVKDAKDFKNKILELENNNDLYLNIINQCMNTITKEDLDGSYINNIIFENIAKDLHKEYKPKYNIEFKFKKTEL